jgi:ketosteroid isomerase-like protein
MKARIYGEVVVITGQSTIRAKAGGQEESGEYRFTDVWERRGNLWQAIASQVTRVTKP